MLRTVHRLYARQLQEQLPASPGAGDYVSMGKAVWLPLCSQLGRAHERVHMKGQGFDWFAFMVENEEFARLVVVACAAGLCRPIRALLQALPLAMCLPPQQRVCVRPRG